MSSAFEGDGVLKRGRLWAFARLDKCADIPGNARMSKKRYTLAEMPNGKQKVQTALVSKTPGDEMPGVAVDRIFSKEKPLAVSPRRR